MSPADLRAEGAVWPISCPPEEPSRGHSRGIGGTSPNELGMAALVQAVASWRVEQRLSEIGGMNALAEASMDTIGHLEPGEQPCSTRSVSSARLLEGHIGHEKVVWPRIWPRGTRSSEASTANGRP